MFFLRSDVKISVIGYRQEMSELLVGRCTHFFCHVGLLLFVRFIRFWYIFYETLNARKRECERVIIFYFAIIFIRTYSYVRVLPMGNEFETFSGLLENFLTFSFVLEPIGSNVRCDCAWLQDRRDVGIFYRNSNACNLPICIPVSGIEVLLIQVLHYKSAGNRM